MKVFDADGHIMEPPAMFANMDKEFYSRRPIATELPLDTLWGEGNLVWLLEGRILPNTGGRGGRTGFFLPGSVRSQKSLASVGDQSLEDVDARLAGIDRFEIDAQMLYPTMFLANAVEDVKFEGALHRAYNDYSADACNRSGGRLKWAAPIPFRDSEQAIAEVRRASKLGASGIFSLGMVYDRQLSDPSFYPIYEAMSEEDLPLCVHLGWGSPKVTEAFTDRNAFFCSAAMPVMWGFFYVMSSGLLSRFPKLKVGFIEAGAGWLPYTINQVRRFYKPPTVLRGTTPPIGDINPDLYRDPAEWFKDGRAFVTCELEEDLKGLTDLLGEDALMLSSDYPHGDPSAEETFVAQIRERCDLSQRAKEKLVLDNASRFYRI